ncbi:MAG: OsmC family protein [Gemmatimonadota bacterium]
MRSLVVGEIGERDGTLRIMRIRVRYEIEIPAGKRSEAERALEHHVSHCPVAQTLTPCVEIEWEAEIKEV